MRILPCINLRVSISQARFLKWPLYSNGYLYVGGILFQSLRRDSSSGRSLLSQLDPGRWDVSISQARFLKWPHEKVYYEVLYVISFNLSGEIPQVAANLTEAGLFGEMGFQSLRRDSSSGRPTGNQRMGV